MGNPFAGIQCGSSFCEGKPKCPMHHQGDPPPIFPHPPTTPSPLKSMIRRKIFVTPTQTVNANTSMEHKYNLDLSPKVSTTPVVTGLKNTMNNCYLNAAMQVLAHLPGFTSNMIDASDRCKEEGENEAKFTIIIGHILKEMLSEKYEALSLKELKIMIGNEHQKYRGNGQQDAHEVMMFLIDKVQEEGKTDIQNLLYGKVEGNIKCKDCPRDSNVTDRFNCLITDIPPQSGQKKIYNLDDCMAFSSRYEVNGPCEKCGSTKKAMKIDKISQEPEILIIQLKRFDANGYKDERLVNFPVKWKKQKRRLIAVIEHSQFDKEKNTGHYAAKCFNTTRRKWFYLNDQTAKPWEGKIQDKKAYVLVYAKEDSTVGRCDGDAINICTKNPSCDQSVTTESTKILARFCIDAPSTEVRDCIRQYSEKKSYKQQAIAFNTFSKSTIIETLLFLGAKREWKDYVKDACVKELIYRIQCLLPEACAICKESYCFRKDDPELLSCSICHQQVHRECYLPLLKQTGDGSSLISEAVLKVPGFHFFCPSCESNFIPKTDSGLKKSKLNGTDSSQLNSLSTTYDMKSPIMDDSTQVNGVDTSLPEKSLTKEQVNRKSQPTTKIKNNNMQPISHSTQQDKENKGNSSSRNLVNRSNKPDSKNVDQTREDQEQKMVKNIICNRYRQNNCEHGLKGKGCNYSHPKRCSKLMNYGTKSGKGCNLGKHCSDFHPKMCPSSISKFECFDDKCTFCHIKGTKRRKVLSSEKRPKEDPDTCKNKNTNNTNSKSVSFDEETILCQTNDARRRKELLSEKKGQLCTGTEGKDRRSDDENSFLVQLNLLKKEFQEVVDSKITSLLQYPYQFSPRIYQQNQLPMLQTLNAQVPLTTCGPIWNPCFQQQTPPVSQVQQQQFQMPPVPQVHQYPMQPFPQVQQHQMHPHF